MKGHETRTDLSGNLLSPSGLYTINLDQTNDNDVLTNIILHIRNGKRDDDQDDLDHQTAGQNRKVSNTLLLLRGFSCSNRYVMIVNSGKSIAGAFNGSWSGTTAAIQATGIYCFLTDGLLTLLSSHESVTNLCANLDLPKSIRKQLQLARDKKFSPMLFIVAPIAMGNAWFKGFLGIITVFNDVTALITDHPPAYLPIIFQVFGHLVGFGSAICFYAFQIKGLALMHTRIRKNLQGNVDWMMYCEKHKWWIRWNKFENFILALANALAGAVTILIYKNSVSIEWGPDTLFLSMALSNIVLNVHYTSGPKHFFECIENEKKEDKKRDNNKTCCERSLYTLLFYCIQFICITNTLGTCVALPPGLIHPLLKITGKTTLKDENPWVILSVTAFLLFLAALTFPRDWSMWVKKSKEMIGNFLAKCWNDRNSAQYADTNVINDAMRSAPSIDKFTVP